MAKIKDKERILKTAREKQHSGHTSEENKNTNSKRYMHPNVHSSVLFTIAKIWKQPKCPTMDEWIRTWYTHTHTHIHTHTHSGILLSHKKE